MEKGEGGGERGGERGRRGRWLRGRGCEREGREGGVRAMDERGLRACDSGVRMGVRVGERRCNGVCEDK